MRPKKQTMDVKIKCCPQNYSYENEFPLGHKGRDFDLEGGEGVNVLPAHGPLVPPLATELRAMLHRTIYLWRIGL